MKILLFLGALADSAVFWTLLYLGAEKLFDGSTYEGCALICTCVVYQRAWKAEMLNLRMGKSQ